MNKNCLKNKHPVKFFNKNCANYLTVMFSAMSPVSIYCLLIFYIKKNTKVLLKSENKHKIHLQID